MVDKQTYFVYIPLNLRVMGKRRMFYLTDLQYKRLTLMSKKLGLSMSEILRRAIDEYWERFERKAKK